MNKLARLEKIYEQSCAVIMTSCAMIWPAPKSIHHHVCCLLLLSVAMIVLLACCCSSIISIQLASCESTTETSTRLFSNLGKLKNVFTSSKKQTSLLTSSIREANDKLCKLQDDPADYESIINQLKQIELNIKGKLLTDTVLDTNESLMQTIGQLLMPERLAEELRFCKISSTNALRELDAINDELEEEIAEEVRKSASKGSGLMSLGRKKSPKCNKLSHVIEYYFARRFNICPEQYYERFQELEVDYKHEIERVQTSTLSLIKKLTGVNNDLDEPQVIFSAILSVFMDEKVSAYNASLVKLTKEDIFHGALQAFRSETKLANESPFVYEPTLNNVEQVLYQFLLLPCKHFLINYQEVMEALDVDTEAALWIKPDKPEVISMDWPTSRQFYERWMNYKVCDLLLTDDGQIFTDKFGKGISEEMMNEYREILLETGHTSVLNAEKTKLDESMFVQLAPNDERD